MPDNNLTDAELVILSLICEQPLHGYQIEQEIAHRNMQAWTGLATSSIYYVLQQLQKKGCIEKIVTSAPQQGALRKVYQITPGGAAVWKTATLQALAQPKITYTNFLMGLHNLWNIPAAEALAAVKTYRDWLEQDLQRQRDELAGFGSEFFPLDVLFDYGFVLGDAELSFLADLIGRLQEMAGSSQE